MDSNNNWLLRGNRIDFDLLGPAEMVGGKMMRSETSKAFKDLARLVRGPKCGGCGKRIVGKIAGYKEKWYPYGPVELVPLCRNCVKENGDGSNG